MTDVLSANMPRIGRVIMPITMPVKASQDLFDQSVSQMRTFCRSVRNQFGNQPNTKLPSVATSDMRIGYIGENVSARHVITLRPTGCSWCTKGGGCVMCGHYLASTGTPPQGDEILREIKSLDPEQPDIVLCIYNGGSMLNPEEMPTSLIRQICEVVSEKENVKKLVFETRPEFISITKIQELIECLRDDQQLVLSIGVESASDHVRDLCINKGFSFDDVCEATAPFRDMFRYYAFFGAPFLTEAEMVSDTYYTILQLKQLDPEDVHIEAATIQHGTVLARLWKNDFYRLPSLWSLVFLLKSLPEDMRPYVSPFNHFPMPELIPQSCSQCHALLCLRLSEYNRIKDPCVFDDINCQCLDTWLQQIQLTDSRPLEVRAQHVFKELGISRATVPEFRLETWWSENAPLAKVNIGSSGAPPMSISNFYSSASFQESLFNLVLDDESPEGSNELREAIASLYAQMDVNSVIITVGASEALLLAFKAFPEFTKTAVFTPCYQPLISIPHSLKQHVLNIPLHHNGSKWTVDLTTLDRVLKQQPEVFVLNFPNNPTGANISEELSQEIITYTSRRGGWIISDESFLAFDPEWPSNTLWGVHDRVILVNTLSKAFGLPGLRIGWLAVPDIILSSVRNTKCFTTLSPSVIGQKIAVQALRTSDEILRQQRALTQQNLSYLKSSCAENREVLSLPFPEGGACCFPLIPFNFPSGRELARELLAKYGVFIVPGDVFGYPSHFRLGLGCSSSSFRYGIDKLFLVLRDMAEDERSL